MITFAVWQRAFRLGRLYLNSMLFDFVLEAVTHKPLADRGFPLTESAENWIAILDASRTGDIDRVRKLIDAGTDLNCSDVFSGHTPLHNAIGTDNVALVELLLDSGADIEHSNNNTHSTPLECAVVSHRIDMVRLLLDRGAKSDIEVYPDGQPLIAVARDESTPEIVALLATHGRPT